MDGTGFYGKLPFVGDFVRRDLPNELVQSLDDWLQACISQAQSSLGDGWKETFLTSPIWRFVLAPGLLGEVGWLGCLSPSTDKVGRLFPLVVARPLSSDINPYLQAMLADSWCQEIESAILSLFSEDIGQLEEFQERINLPHAPEIPDYNNRAQHLGFGESWQYQGYEYPDGYLSGHLVDQFINHHLGTYSVWWGSGSQLVEPSVAVTRDLPDPHQFVAMLCGIWQDKGWFSTNRQTVQ